MLVAYVIKEHVRLNVGDEQLTNVALRGETSFSFCSMEDFTVSSSREVSQASNFTGEKYHKHKFSLDELSWSTN